MLPREVCHVSLQVLLPSYSFIDFFVVAIVVFVAVVVFFSFVIIFLVVVIIVLIEVVSDIVVTVVFFLVFRQTISKYVLLSGRRWKRLQNKRKSWLGLKQWRAPWMSPSRITWAAFTGNNDDIGDIGDIG